ncbi:DNA-binding protein [Moraxellaceae bacterium AER2_44_116]|nr:DNA-binding protein [Moraxellaceae bacterium AER2_44_116]
MANLHKQQIAISIASVYIKQDAEGRFCLNDLHRAAGGEEKHSPNRFTRSDSFISLVNELTPEMAFAPVESVRGGLAAGTYVCKELVYAYAMWISASFHLKVIRTFDAVVSQPVSQFIIPTNLHEALRFAADLAEQKAVLEEQVQANAPKVQFHDLVTEAVNCQSIEQVAKVLGTGRNRFFAWLRKKDFLKEDNQPYQPYLDRGYFKVIEAQYNDKKHGDSHTYTKTLITGKGLTFFQKRFVAEVA